MDDFQKEYINKAKETQKCYREKNKKKISQYNKIWCLKNKDKRRLSVLKNQYANLEEKKKKRHQYFCSKKRNCNDM